MPRTPEGLGRLADELFAPELAEEVKSRVDAASAALLPPHGPARHGHPQVESIATAFLGDALYEHLGAGTFSGRPIVEWNGYDLVARRPTFVLRPNPEAPFRYTTAAGRVIEPRLMDTDGGTIPLALHGIGKFSPWGYAPAYIIHDWLFVAHKCALPPDDDITFEQSADILGEAIKTLTVSGYATVDGAKRFFPKDEDTLYLIHTAVGSSIARRMWDDLVSAVCRG